MAQVPYSPVPDVAPQSPGEQVSVATPGAAFGENIGAALKGLGSSVEGAGNELFARATALQELTNQADARNAQTEYATQAAKMQADFDAKEGKDSYTTLDQHLQNLADLRKQIRGTLKTPMAQQHYDSDSLPFMQRMIFTSAGRAAEQHKGYVIGTAQANADLTARNFVNPDSEDEFQSKLHQIDDSGDTIAGSKGWSQPQLDDWKLNQKSKLWLGKINALAKGGQTDKAFQLLDSNKTSMTQPDYDKATDIVRQQNRTIGSKVLGDAIYGDGSKPLTQMFQEAKDRSPDLAHNDPLFEHDVEMYIRTKTTYDKSAISQQQHQAKNDLYTLITRNNPTSMQQLLASEGGQAAFNQLSPEDQKQVPSWINSWFKQKDQIANEMEYNRLRGMAITAPQDFLNTDLSTIKVSPGQLTSLLDLRGRVTKNAEVDPQVQKAIGFMRRNFGTQMTALGIYNRDKSSPDDYDHFTGALEEAINAHMQAHNGKPPSGPEMMEIGKDLLKTHPQSGFFGTYGRLSGYDKPFYDVPQSVLDSVGADVRRVDPQATDQEIYRASLRQIFKDLYAGSAKPSQPGQ